MKDKTFRKIIELAEKFGHTVDKVERSKHHKIYMTTKAGKKMLTVSITASDDRAVKNNEAILKRWAI